MTVLFSNTVQSQVTLTGKITDKITGEALYGATIYIPDLKTGDVSNDKGMYKIENLPKTKVLIQINYLGYKTKISTIDLKITTIANFELDEEIMEMKSVVITGSSKASEIKENPIPVATISRKIIDQNISTNIIDAIANLPGVNAVTTGPNVSKPFIHGLGYNRVLTLYDGIRQEGQQWGDEHGEEVDDYAVDRVEVIKGPSSLIYGSDALAGVVNLIPFPPVTDGDLIGSFLSEYQTNNGLIGNSLALASNNKGFIWGGRISHKMATNYQNSIDGRVYGTAYNETSGNGYIGLTRKWGYSHLNFTFFNDLQEIPDGSRDSTTRKFTKQVTEADTLPRPIVHGSELNSYKIATLHQSIQHYRIYSTNNFIIGSGKLGVTIGFQQNDRREFSHPQQPDIPGLYLSLNTFTYDLKYFLPEIKGWDLTFGVNGMGQNNTNKGTEFIIPDYKEFDIGPFVHLKKSFGKIDLSAGIRYDTRFLESKEMYVTVNPITGFDMQVVRPDTMNANHTFSKYNHSFSGVSGSLGITYNISKNVLIKANIARGFRAPNIYELCANGVHSGSLLYELGNPESKPEFSLQEDIGMYFTSKYMNFNVEVFNNNINNFIFNRKILNNQGKDSVIVHGNQTFKFQQSAAELYGMEASIDIHPHPLDWLHFENSISVIYSINRDGNGVHLNDSSKYLPLMPPFHWHSELRADIKKKLTHFSSSYAKIEMDYFATQSRVYLAYNTETPTRGYTLLNLGIGSDVTNKTGKVLFSFSILCNNVADIAYQSHLSRLKYFEPYPLNPTGRSGIYNMGRNIGFKVIIPITIKSDLIAVQNR
jgi:iron complex outermembrane recepter protein